MIDADCRLRRLRGCVAAAAAAAARAPADADATASQPAAGPRPPRPPAAQPCQLIGQLRPPPPGDWRQADGAKYRGMLACDGCGGCSRPASPQVSSATICSVPPWPATWQMNASTIIMPCNYTGFQDPATTAGWGIVDFVSCASQTCASAVASAGARQMHHACAHWCRRIGATISPAGPLPPQWTMTNGNWRK
jgi:hypothetical protein